MAKKVDTLRKALFAEQKLHPVTGDGLPDGLFVREMLADEYHSFCKECLDMSNDGSSDDVAAWVSLIIKCTVNEDGEKVFTEEDREALRNSSGRLLVELFTKTQAVNGLSGEVASGKMGEDSKQDRT